MKLFLITCFMSFTLLLQGQKKTRIDTVFATTNKTTTLMFPEDVIMVNIDSEDFGWIKSANLVLLKAAIESAAPTSIVVQYGVDKEVYHGTVAYTGLLNQAILNFKETEIPKMPNSNRIKQDSLKSLEQDLSNKRLNILVSDTKNPYKTYALKKEGLLITLSNMMVDDENVYIKLLFKNGSKLDYLIDFTEFVYRDPIEKGDLKGSYDKKNVYPITTNSIDGIRAKDERFLGYCIPRYSLGRKGDLLITVREKKGSRIMEISIPFSEIMEAQAFNKQKL